MAEKLNVDTEFLADSGTRWGRAAHSSEGTTSIVELFSPAAVESPAAQRLNV